MRKSRKATRAALALAGAVADHPGANSRQLRLDLGADPVALTHAIAAAERRGLVRRELHVVLTPAGEAFVRGERKGPRAAGVRQAQAAVRKIGSRR